MMENAIKFSCRNSQYIDLKCQKNPLRGLLWLSHIFKLHKCKTFCTATTSRPNPAINYSKTAIFGLLSVWRKFCMFRTARQQFWYGTSGFQWILKNPEVGQMRFRISELVLSGAVFLSSNLDLIEIRELHLNQKYVRNTDTLFVNRHPFCHNCIPTPYWQRALIKLLMAGFGREVVAVYWHFWEHGWDYRSRSDFVKSCGTYIYPLL